MSLQEQLRGTGVALVTPFKKNMVKPIIIHINTNQFISLIFSRVNCYSFKYTKAATTAPCFFTI